MDIRRILYEKWGLKAQPFIIGILAGFMAEQNFRRAIMYSEGISPGKAGKQRKA